MSSGHRRADQRESSGAGRCPGADGKPHPESPLHSWPLSSRPVPITFPRTGRGDEEIGPKSRGTRVHALHPTSASHRRPHTSRWMSVPCHPNRTHHGSPASRQRRDSGPTHTNAERGGGEVGCAKPTHPTGGVGGWRAQPHLTSFSLLLPPSTGVVEVRPPGGSGN